MNRCIENIKSFLAEQTPCFGYDNAHSVLEMLCYYYTVANPVDNPKTRCQFKKLNDISCHLPLPENDAIFHSNRGVVCGTGASGVSGWGSCGNAFIWELNGLPDENVDP